VLPEVACELRLLPESAELFECPALPPLELELLDELLEELDEEEEEEPPPPPPPLS
jgi:hypothetical protein